MPTLTSRSKSGIRVVLLACLVLTLGSSLFGACDAPHYRKGVVWENSQSVILMDISIRPSDFAPSRLACLAENLRQRYPDRRTRTIFIFSSHAAAEQYRPYYGDAVGGPAIDWSRQMHGVYSYDSDKGDEYLELMPLGQGSGPYVSRIDLSGATPRHCRLQINGRCLLAAENLRYPWDALKAKVSGTVTLTASIRPDGRMAGVQVVEGNVNAGESNSLLAHAASEALRIWRFEPAQHEDSLRITYQYAIDGSPDDEKKPRLEFDLPSKIIIRARPIY